MHCLIRSTAVALTLAAAGTAQAQVVASTFGPGDSFRVANTISVIQGYAASWFSVAAPFTASAGGALTTLRVAAFARLAGDALQVGLYDGADMNTATLLESFWSGTIGTTASIVTFASVLHPLLTGGGSYLLALSAAGPDGWYAWNQSTLPVIGVTQFKGVPGSDWYGSMQLAQAYDVTVRPVVTAAPEPATLALVVTGLLAVGGLARVRRRRV